MEKAELDSVDRVVGGISFDGSSNSQFHPTPSKGITATVVVEWIVKDAYHILSVLSIVWCGVMWCCVVLCCVVSLFHPTKSQFHE